MFYRFLPDEKHRSAIYVDLKSSIFNKLEEEEILEVIRIYEEYFNEKVNYVFLDEIQSLKNWWSVLGTLIDFDYFLLISGSSSKLLPRELSSKSRGRSLSYLLLPFSLRELLAINGLELKKECSLSEEVRIKKSLKIV